MIKSIKSIALLATLAFSPSLTAAPHTEKIISGLDMPVFMTSPKGQDRFFYILEKKGKIRLFDRKAGKLVDKPFLDITDQIKIKMNEQGLLGMAFSPNYSKDKQFYLYYTDNDGDTQISRFKVEGDNKITEEKLISIKQDFRNHNGGWLGFGPDGYLYIGTGDGGAGNDPKQRAQDKTQLLGKLLRIDVSSGKGYHAKMNKVSKKKPEIYAYGLRNPWRCAWDGDDLYIADVGQNKYEEINVIHKDKLKGANFGWRLREGTHKTPSRGVGGDKPDEAIEPIHEYNRKSGYSITGGFVYRGAIDELKGNYFYADYVSNRIWSLQLSDGEATKHKEWTADFKYDGKAIKAISSFAQDSKGEVYIISHSGSIYMIKN